MSSRQAWAWTLAAHMTVGLAGALTSVHAWQAWQERCALVCEAGYRGGPAGALALASQAAALLVALASVVWLLLSASRDADRNEESCRRLIIYSSTAACVFAAVAAAIALDALLQDQPGARASSAIGASSIAAIALLPLAARSRPTARVFLCTLCAAGALVLAGFLVVPAPLLILFAGLQLMAVSSSVFAAAREGVPAGM